jgi:predicted permease
MGAAVLADLERELALRQKARGNRWSDTLWLARVGLTVAFRLRLAAGMRGIPRGAASLTGELEMATKGLVRSPGLAFASVVILALGVTAPTITYSVVAAHLRPIPISNWEQLVTVTHVTPGGSPNGRPLTASEFAALRQSPGSLGTVAGYQSVAVDLSGGGGEPVQLRGARVTDDLLAILRGAPTQGRGFVVDDADESVAVLGEGLWRRRFGSDPTLVGRSIRLDGLPHVVVGILPERLRFPTGAEVWLPMRWTQAPGALSPVTTVGRLPPAVPLERADDEVRASLEGVSATQGRGEGGRFTVSLLAPRLGVSPREDLPQGLGWLALASCLLLVAAANVSNLFVCRAIARRHSFAVRSALGAGRSRLIAMHLTEAGVVSVLGGIIGMSMTVWVIRSFAEVFTFEDARWWRDMRVEPAMFWLALAFVTLSAVVAGLVPAFRATGKNVEADLRGDRRSGGVPRLGRVSQALIVVEVALSVALALQALLSTAPVLELPGSFEAREVLAAGYTLRPEEHANDLERVAFHRNLLDRVAGQPNVDRVSLLAPLPGRPGREASILPADLSPRGEDDGDGTAIVVTAPGAFDVLGVPLLEGRDLRWSDGEPGSLSVLVNEAYAQRYWSGESALGRHVIVPELGAATVVGVAPTLGIMPPRGVRPDAIYVPIPASPPSDPFLIASSVPGEDPMDLLAGARSALESLDPDKPYHTVGTPQSLFAYQWTPIYGMAGLFGWMGLAGLLMAGTGLFAVMAFTVAGRTHELGLRRALGATRSRLIRAVLGQAAVWLTQGLMIGLAISLVLRPTVPMAATLRGQPHLFLLVATALIATGLAAAAVPALRAVHVEPTVALRAE